MASKPVITYKMLLNLVTEKGLKSIKTQIVQLPTEENHHVAVARATVILDGGREFDGTADAAPNNVSQAMVTCLPRMAETRAKARAMRDAVNIGEVALEELPGYDDTQDAAPRRSGWGGNVGAPSAAPTKSKPLPEGPILPSQAEAIANLCHKAGVDPPGGMEDWTNAQACEYIRSQQKARN